MRRLSAGCLKQPPNNEYWEEEILKTSRTCTAGALLAAAMLMAGCASTPSWLPSSGPSTADVVESAKPGPSEHPSGIQLVEVNDAVARRVMASQKRSLFSETFPAALPKDYMVGSGDMLEVSIWESPPASLFGTNTVDPRNGSSTSRLTSLPEQMVNTAGQINIPFAGAVPVQGRSPNQIEKDIVDRLKGKANQPQVLVRVMRNSSSNVTVVGEFASSTRLQLTARGERLLDAVAAAGGTRQPVGKITVQLTRGNTVQSLPLDTIIQDPAQNIVLQAGDVVTALNKPLSFIILGATGRNEELDFEAQGITLAQALARAGGLQDQRADVRGVFIFRFEDPVALGLVPGPQLQTTPDGKVPVIYQVNLKDPGAFFVAQGFPIRNKDVMYVSNAPAAELQKFLNIIGSVVAPIAAGRVATGTQ